VRLLLLGAACHQITQIVTESLLFEPVRRGLRTRSRYLGELVSCHLCFSTWVAMFFALVFRPAFVVPHGFTRSRGPDTLARVAAAAVVDTFAIAAVARAVNEVLGLMKREVELREEEVEELQEERAEVGAARR
jgi:hypothetical protein